MLLEHAAHAVLWPVLAKLLPRYPDIKVEVIVDYGLTDIVAQRYDADNHCQVNCGLRSAMC